MDRTLACAMSLIALVLGHSRTKAAERSKTPSVVVILADDLGYGDVQRLTTQACK